MRDEQLRQLVVASMDTTLTGMGVDGCGTGVMAVEPFKEDPLLLALRSHRCLTGRPDVVLVVTLTVIDPVVNRVKVVHHPANIGQACQWSVPPVRLDMYRFEAVPTQPLPQAVLGHKARLPRLIRRHSHGRAEG